LHVDPQLASAAAADLRDAVCGLGAGVLRRRRQGHGRTGLWRVHVALPATAAMARGQFWGSVPWGHLEPPVVSGLPVGLHAFADGDAATAPFPAWTACLGMARAPARHAAFVGAGTGVLHLPGRPETPVSGKSRIDR